MSIRTLLLCALLWPAGGFAQAPAEAETEGAVTWPVPWAVGRSVQYDHAYSVVNKVDGKPVAVKMTGTTSVEIVRADAEGFVQRWLGRDTRLDTGDLPTESAGVMTAAVEALRDLALDVRLDREGAFAGIDNMDTLQPQYARALGTMFDGMAGAAAQASDPAAREARNHMLAMLTARPVLEQQLSDLPAAYNFVAAGGLELDAGYTYEDQGTSPVGGGAITMRNRMRLSEGEDPAYYQMRWEVEPDPAQMMAAIRHAASRLLEPAMAKADAAKKQQYQRELEAVGKGAKFSTTVDYVIEKSSGIVERMEMVQVKRFDKKDETTTTRLQRRR